ncbi:raftlin-2 isoform X1 [Suncus etruscus]|uniref:raftlin-2 isoform X1 n=1 Tax=Suncus etruscus TaxID=109475 RepID=UPI00211045FD|nr:raftlin-2 isoform X1 [Suncus etruscus]
MGCGLRKLENPDDSSPGKIYSTLKRPQVETKTEFAYEYVLLDFTLQASSNPEVIKINSVQDIATKVKDYYLKGYIVRAIHPVLQPLDLQKQRPANYLYRAVLSRLKVSPKRSSAPSQQRHPRLVIEECPLTSEAQASDVVKLIEKINAAAKNRKKFVGFLSQHYSPLKYCNGTNHDGEQEPTLHVRNSSDEKCGSWNEGTLSGQSSESGIEEEFHESGQYQTQEDGSPHSTKSQKGEDNKLYIVFNVFDDIPACWTYHEGALTMKVTRKGLVVTTLDADWLELTSFYYKQGLSLIDYFVCWEPIKGEHLSKCLEGLFIYEEEDPGVPGFIRKGNDAIIVEQWTVIEGSEIKADYGPLLHTLAEFGWLLTSVLPTPILRYDSEGNLATKQIVFLQRPVMWNSATQMPERKSSRHLKAEYKSKGASRSVGLDTTTSQPTERRSLSSENLIGPSRECWMQERKPAPSSSFSGFSSRDSVHRELDDGQLDQEDGVTQVTCM